MQVSSGVTEEASLSDAMLADVVRRFKAVYRDANVHLPQSGSDQLRLAVVAALASWNSQQAQRYRKVNNTGDVLGTAVTVQVLAWCYSTCSASSGARSSFAAYHLHGIISRYRVKVQCSTH
jgi:pyruvate, orthophosphate dikinase